MKQLPAKEAAQAAEQTLAQGDAQRAETFAVMACRSAHKDPAVTRSGCQSLISVGRHSEALLTGMDLFIRTGTMLSDELEQAARKLKTDHLSPEHQTRLREALKLTGGELASAVPPPAPTLLKALGGAALRLDDRESAMRILSCLLEGPSPCAESARQIAKLLADGVGSISTKQAGALVSALADAPKALSAAARSLSGRGQAEQARVIYSRMIENGCGTEESYRDLAKMEMEANPTKAEAVLTDGLALFPGSGWLRMGRAHLYANRGQQDEALQEAAAGYEALPNAWIGAAYLRLLIRFKRFGHLHRVLERIVSNHPGSPEILIPASHGLELMGDSRTAFELAEKAFRLGFENPWSGIRLLKAGIAESQIERAEEILREVWASERSRPVHHPAVVYSRVLQQLEIHNIDERLVTRMLSLVRDEPTSVPVGELWEVARGLLRQQRPSEASVVVANALVRTDPDALPRSAVGLISDVLGFDAWNDLPPAEARRSLGKALVAAGLAARGINQPLKACIAFRMAAFLSPEEATARINAAFAELSAGNIVQAWRHFDTVDRVYDKAMANVAWPQVDQKPWPRGRLGTQFDSLKPSRAEWPLISVITPSLNQGRYIEDTILSVINQGYPRLQYIVVDGVSTDETSEVLKKYEAHFDVLIVEKDEGQTQAINKGFAQAQGDLITWINADDLLAPGALHMAALSWLRSDADLVYGICFTHRDGQFQIANMPQVTQETFSVELLGDVFEYWRKGFFFYQPEVFFTRRILERTGGTLDESLYYTMDYEFWSRCAQAGARIQAVHWPIAFFRQHDEQKTANVFDCAVEQAGVRDRFVRLEPSEGRRAEIAQRLKQALCRRPVRIEVVTTRLPRLLSRRMPEDLAASFADSRFQPKLVRKASFDPDVDLIVRLVHLQHDETAVRTLRETSFEGPLIGWFWDNHHHVELNYKAAEVLDVVIPGHAFAGNYLANRGAIQLPSVPLSAGQWSAREAERFFAAYGAQGRTDRLYGGFVHYAFAQRRNKLIQDLAEGGFDGVALLSEADSWNYLGRSAEERFREWAAHKVSICLPLLKDLSLRLFEALLTGQVPIVPKDVVDLDAVISPDLQAALPIIRFDRYDLEEVRQAHAAALAAFDAEGQEGALRRHRYALKHHTFEARIEQLLADLENLDSRLCDTTMVQK